MKNKANIIVGIFLILLVLLAIFIGNTRPIDDGDMWWQIAYGKYMLENNTLIPDHTIYTWTPADNSVIYCAWISEIFFYKLYSVFGPMALFALRYIVGVLTVFLVFFYAYKRGVLWHPLTGLIGLIFVLIYSSSSGSFIKPEMFTHLFMTVMVFTYWYVRHKGDEAWWMLYLLPVIMLLWVNSHGGFIFAFPFLALVLAGEILNLKLNSDDAISSRLRKHLIITLVLTGFAVFITPYGWKYPLQLAQIFTGGQDLEQLKTVSAYQSSLKVPTLVLYFGLPILVLLYVTTVSKRWYRQDMVLILTNVSYAILYTIYGRLIYYWAPVFAFSAIWILKEDRVFTPELRRIFKIAFVVIIMLTCIDQSRWQAYKSILDPDTSKWFGLGNSYINSHEESEFIQKYYKDYKIGNDYNGGGYLLWRLGPETKIMIDPRFFPFKAWYNRYMDFMVEKNVDSFLKDFSFDVLHLQYNSGLIYPYFLKSPDWRLVFYGTGGMIFARKDLPVRNNGLIRGSAIFHCNNVHQSAAILNFSLMIGDWAVAKTVLGMMKHNFTWYNQNETITAAENNYRGVKAYYNRDYKNALSLLVGAAGKVPLNSDMLWSLYYFRAVDLWTAQDAAGALDCVKKALEFKSEDPYGMFNTGIINWVLLKDSEGKISESLTLNTTSLLPDDTLNMRWRKPLEEFLKRTKGNPGAMAAQSIAMRILEGKYKGKPPLLYPPEPPKLNI